jgi:hypothetical protein
MSHDLPEAAADEEVQGAVFLRENSIFAFWLTAPMLDRLICDCAEGKITVAEYDRRLKEEVHYGRMFWVGTSSPLVEITGTTLGCLAEFRIPQSRFQNRLCYTYCMYLEARPI